MDGSPGLVMLGHAVLPALQNGWTPDGRDSENQAPFEITGWGFVKWQTGPIQEVGRNGILLEELIEFVIIPRLVGFNRPTIPDPGPKTPGAAIPNPFRNRETSLAITHFEEGLNWLKRRTELRQRQGVEGTFKAHVDDPLAGGISS